MNILGMGPVEILVVLVIAMLVLGPERMMDVARTGGKLFRDFRRTMDSFPRSLDDLLDEPKAQDNASPKAQRQEPGGHPEAQPRPPSGAQDRAPKEEPSGPTAPS